jgi:hypothetical protein
MKTPPDFGLDPDEIISAVAEILEEAVASATRPG